MIRSYKKVPVVIQAVEWTGHNVKEIFAFAGSCAYLEDENLSITTLEGNLRASVGDFIIKGTKDEFYPCKPGIFKDIYEEVSIQPTNI